LAECVQPWGIPVACLHEFLAVVTKLKIFAPPSTNEQALLQIATWLASPQAQILHSGVQHWQVLRALALKAKIAGGQFHDARIAAICVENGVDVMWSADRDFSRFKGLKVVNPL
jgi:uncharacterized protein